MVPASDQEELLGTWIYGKDSAPSRYTLEDAANGGLKLKERLPTGVWVSGDLKADGDWFTTPLKTPEGKTLGVMRLRFDREDGTVRSNVRGASSSVWGKDIVAKRDPDVVVVVKKKPNPVDALSKFFDTIESRVCAEQPLKLAANPRQSGLRGRRAVPRAPPVVLAADTAISSALATADPLKDFGYSMSRLKAAGGNMTCAETTPAGAPLLAIPMEKCWTAEGVVKESPKLAKMLEEALGRNPKSTMLKADGTWIALHILQAKAEGAAAPPHRKAHLALMPKSPETLLAWAARDLEALHGSRWQEVAKQRQAQLASDFAILSSELGAAAVKEMTLNLQDYTWARQVIQQLSLSFVGPDGRSTEVVVPGLEMLEPDVEMPPNPEGIRMELAGGKTPSVVVYAGKDFSANSVVTVSHAGLACSTGFWLLGGRVSTMEFNPCEVAEVMLRFPLGHEDIKPNGWFWETVDGLEEALAAKKQTRPGDCLSPLVAEAQPQVEMAYRRGEPELRVHLRLSKKALLPGRMALWRLGLVILAHNERANKVFREEEGVLNPLGVDACERRALSWLMKRIDWLLQEGPARPDEDVVKLMQGVTGDAPRRVRGLKVVLAERQILAEALEAINERLAIPAEPSARVEAPAVQGEGVLARVYQLQAGEEPEEGSDLGCAVAQLRGCTTALTQLAEGFKKLLAGSKLAEADGKGLKDELAVIQGVLAGSPLKPAVGGGGDDVVVKACAEASKTALAAELAMLQWSLASAEKAGKKDAANEALLGAAKVKAKLADFAAAHVDLKKYVGLVATPSTDVAKLAQSCALSAATRSEKVLSGSWTGCGGVLKALREKMRSAGYMKAGAQWPWPTRCPPEKNVADGFQAMWSEGSKMAKDARKLKNKVPASTWWVLKEAKKELRGLLRLFVLREPLKLAEASEFLGADALKLLLERSALSVYSAKDANLLAPDAAAKLAPSADGVVIANVALWPVEDDVLVAIDFEQDSVEGFEPVTYLGEDSKALLLASSRQAPGKAVLDVCCGSGAQGLAALKRSSEKAVFLDSNPRALRFAAFGAALSGVEDKATFVEGSISSDGLPKGVQGPFDVILAGLPFLPNPNNVIAAGTAFKHADGETVLSALMSKASKLLSPGGSLTLTSMVRDVDDFAERVKDCVGMSTGFHAEVFRGKAIAADDFAGRVTTGCPEVQGVAYYRGLEKQMRVETMSEAMVLLWAPQEGMGSVRSKVEIRAEESGLWTNEDYLWRELERLLLAVGVSNTEEPLYTMDWAKGKQAATGDDTLSLPQSSSSAASKYAPKTSKEQQKEFASTKGLEGATWNDIVQVNGPGFSPPVLCDLLWAKAGGVLKADKKAVPHIYSSRHRVWPFAWGMLDFQTDIKPPEALVEALTMLGCTDRIHHSAGSFSVQKEYLRVNGGVKREVKISNYDIVVVPILSKGVRATTPVVELPSTMLALLKSVMKQLKKRAKPARIVLLTCGCIGPSYPDGVGEQVPSAAPVLGLIRTMRIEVPQVPILWIDSDEMSSFGSGVELLTQLNFELDVATPKNGIWGVSTQERAVMLLSNNRDAAYRNGQRYLPKLDLSPQMPIYLGCEVPPLPKAAAEGVVLVTGGVGGLGLVAAEALVEAGAQCVVLSSKSGDVPKGQGVERRVQAMQEKDVTVVVEKCDTSKDREVQKLLDRLRSNYGPLTAVIHSAGLLADAPVDQQDSGMMTHVFEPKAQGAYYLHKHTQEDELAVFMMFSSIAALRGSPNQANYASACAYLDELARLRRAQGLAGVSVQWPGVDLTGRTVKDGNVVGLGTVKQVIKKLACGLEATQPVQAVLPKSYLAPSSPPLRSLLEPLLSRGKAISANEEAEEKPKAAQGSGVKAPRVSW